MAKKKKTETFKTEQSLEQRRKAFLQSTIGEGILLGAIGFYLGMTLQAILVVDRKANILSAPTKLGAVISDNPVYFIAVFKAYPEKLGLALATSLLIIGMLELLVIIFYFYNKTKIHSNLDTLKGSTKWANAKLITEKYADKDETNNSSKKGWFSKIWR